MDYKMLVNRDNLLEEHFKPSNLVKTDSLYKDDIYLEKETYHAFQNLKKEAQKNHYDIDIMSGYRTKEYQQSLFDELVKQKGYNYAFSYIALPRTSEHETGLALDFAIYKDGKTYIEHSVEELEETKWIHQNAYRFGFIVRYPKDKEEITKYNYEPWHLRYVGSLARYLYTNHMTLEEYYRKF